jgi:hypothetical protein
MRSPLQTRTPTQLLWIITASNAAASIGFGMLSLPAWRRQGQHTLLWCCFAAIPVGLIGLLFAEQALRDGINSEQWPDNLLVALRKLASRRAYSILCGLLMIGAVAYVITFGLHESGGVWMFLLPAMSLTRVVGYLRPKPKSDHLVRPIERPKPLQSENWGAPPHLL